MKKIASFDLFLFIFYGVLAVVLLLTHSFHEKGEVLLLINGIHSPLTDSFFQYITHFGDGLILVPMLLVFVFVRFYYAMILTSVGILHGLAVLLFKKVLYPGLPRPIGFFKHESMLHIVEGVKVHSQNSFPSGHTTTAFAIALTIGLISRKKWLTVITTVLAILVGYSRIYLLQHFYIDTLMGFLIGTASALVVWYLFHNLQQPSWMDARIKVNFSIQKNRQPETAGSGAIQSI